MEWSGKHQLVARQAGKTFLCNLKIENVSTDKTDLRKEVVASAAQNGRKKKQTREKLVANCRHPNFAVCFNCIILKKESHTFVCFDNFEMI